MTRAEIIAALEKAEGPSRELDAEIAVACVWPGAKILDLSANGKKNYGIEKPSGAVIGAPRYTASIDAALTLVPEGAVWTIESDLAWVRMLDGDDVSEFQGGGQSGKNGKKTAIALCLAALEAMEARHET